MWWLTTFIWWLTTFLWSCKSCKSSPPSSKKSNFWSNYRISGQFQNFNQILTYSHLFLPFLTVSSSFSPFLTHSHRFLPFLSDFHRFSLIFTVSHRPEVMHQRRCTRGDALELMHQRNEIHQRWCTWGEFLKFHNWARHAKCTWSNLSYNLQMSPNDHDNWTHKMISSDIIRIPLFHPSTPHPLTCPYSTFNIQCMI